MANFILFSIKSNLRFGYALARRIPLCLLGILWFSLLVGQAPRTLSFRSLTMEDGLSQSSVFAIMQDSDGFMWFGTRNGLNKYDGNHIKVYRKTGDVNSLVNNDVRVLFWDKSKRCLWIGTSSGLSRFEPDVEHFTNYHYDSTELKGLTNNTIRHIYRDTKGRLWVGTAEGLNLYNDQTDSFKKIRTINDPILGLQKFAAKIIYEDQDQQLWVGTRKGIYLLNERNGDWILEQAFPDSESHAGLNASHIKSINGDKQGNFWVGTHNNGIFKWDRKLNQIKNFRSEHQSLSHNNIRSVAISPDGEIWAGTFGRLNRFDSKSERFQQDLTENTNGIFLVDYSVRAVFFDSKGSLWIGTYYDGVKYFHKEINRFRRYQRNPIGNGLNSNIINCFEETADGNLWIGTGGGGLNFLNRKNGRFSHYIPSTDEAGSISGNHIKAILEDGDKVWIGTFEEGLNVLDRKTNQFVHFKHHELDQNTLSNNNVYSLLKHQNKLWIATYGGGLNIFAPSENRFYHYRNKGNNTNSVSSDECRILFKDHGQNIWLGSEKGLDLVELDDSMNLTVKQVLKDIKVYTITETRDHSIWVGTYFNGLIRLTPDRQSQQRYTTEDGLPGNAIMGILEDDLGVLWLSTKNGLSKFNPSNATSTTYGYADGLSHLEFNFNAYCKTQGGEMLFGGINGLTLFHPDSIVPNLTIPPIVFTELKVHNKVIAPHDESGFLSKSLDRTEVLTFKYNEANFSIGFAALDYFKPKYNNYAYQLICLDEDWNYTVGEVQANYTLQKHGTYTFRLRGGNGDGIWNPMERTLMIKVLPPPWLSGWAYGIYFVLMVSIIYAAYYFLRLKHKLQIKQVEKKQQDALHQIKLRFFTNITHELRTPLTLILGPVEDLLGKGHLSLKLEKQLGGIRENARRLLSLVNQLLVFRKLDSEHSQLSVSKQNVVSFLKKIFASFQEVARINEIDYHFLCDEPIIEVWYDSEKIEKVIFNLLSNAFKYTPRGGAISLTIQRTSTNLIVRVMDNGIGIEPKLHTQIFKRFYEKEATFEHSFKGTGIGLAISKQLIELHQGQISVESTLDEGATFTIELLLGKGHFPAESIAETPINLEEQATKTTLTKGSVFSSLTKQRNKSSVLVVEDNLELVDYIAGLLKDQFKVFTATNGQDGFKVAKEKMPDLIISDVMMPIMDGIELCEHLKTNIETSHIPIILVTAHQTTYKTKGLQIGANDFIVKPFSSEELILKIQNLIRIQKSIHQKFRRSTTLVPQQIAVTSADEQFLEKAMQIVENHIDNTSFAVEQFAYELAVSRPLLFNKVKSLTGLTPNNFIKTIRLKRAAQLLKQQKLTVSEVAYKVGFRDPKYFSKCFQQHFQKTPSKFALELE